MLGPSGSMGIQASAADFGSAWPGGEPRDVMTPDPVCP